MRNMTETKRGNKIFLRDEELETRAVSDCIAVLNENVAATLSINELCAKIGYSRAHIFKEFKRATGDTVMSYFTKLKIERAKQQLREGELSVKQIAESLSFDSPNYFSKTFKKVTGLTPIAYKKRNFTNKKS